MAAFALHIQGPILLVPKQLLNALSVKCFKCPHFHTEGTDASVKAAWSQVRLQRLRPALPPVVSW